MEIHYTSAQFSPKKPVILTLGMFDGIHLGHRCVLEYLVKSAQKKGYQSVVFTFDPHPRKVLTPDLNLKQLTLKDEKIQKIKTLGLDSIIIEPFTKEFSRLSYLHFVRDYLVNTIQVKHLLIGHDHRFGSNRMGSFSDLEELAHTYDFTVEQLPVKTNSGIAISSTKIRKALEEGNIHQANTFLGEPYAIKGHVIHGDKIGRSLGFPTANLNVDDQKLIPGFGIYLVSVSWGKKHFYGLLSLGNRPSIKQKEAKLSIEVYLIDFDGYIYGETLEVAFLEKLRDQKKFNSLDQLKKQMEKDLYDTRILLENQAKPF